MINRHISTLKDQHNRFHNYLRISLTEKCNLRCTYCMPEHGIDLLPQSRLMDTDEIIKIASVFVNNGVNIIRLTGGEPLIRKDVDTIVSELSKFNVQLKMTTNGILIDRHIDTFKRCGLLDINVSLDTLDSGKFQQITKRNYFDKVLKNIHLLIREKFNVKINVVLKKGFNDNEICSFIEWTKSLPIEVKFIEFMPFLANNWDTQYVVNASEILETVDKYYTADKVLSFPMEAHATTRKYKIKGHPGSFGIISTVSNPFCDGCNRIRLTSDGKLKNCLFSSDETNLLAAIRNNEAIEPMIHQNLKVKKAVRAGLSTNNQFEQKKVHQTNRSMISIGG